VSEGLQKCSAEVISPRHTKSTHLGFFFLNKIALEEFSDSAALITVLKLLFWLWDVQMENKEGNDRPVLGALSGQL